MVAPRLRRSAVLGLRMRRATVLALADVATTPQNTEVQIPVLDNDVGGGLFISAVGTPAHGSVEIGTGDDANSVFYTPDPSYVGADAFTYTASNGSITSTGLVTVTVTLSPSPPTSIVSGAGVSFSVPANLANLTVLSTMSLGGGAPTGLGTWSITTGSWAKVSLSAATGLSVNLRVNDSNGLDASDIGTKNVTVTYSGEGLVSPLTLAMTINVVSAVSAWADSISQLPWHSGSSMRIEFFDTVRKNPANNKIRKQGFVGTFQDGGTTWSQWASSADSWAGNAQLHDRVVAGSGINIAIRPFSTKAGNIPANYNNILATDCCSPTRPVGYSASITNVNTQLDQAMACWQAAADGKFDGLWTNGLTALRARYDTRLKNSGRASGVAGVRFVLRPFWEENTAYAYGSIKNIGHASYACARTVAEAGVCRAGMKRFCQVARAAWPGCYLHFCPLRGGQHFGNITTFIDTTADGWDIIGPDYYDHGVSLANSGSPTEAEYIARWNAQAVESRGGGPMGIILWGNYVRSVGKKLGVGEWGLWPFNSDAEHDNEKQNGGGDNYVFVQRMHRMFSVGPVAGTTSISTVSGFADIMAYETYFNYFGDTVPDHMLSIGTSPASLFPNASLAYRALWGTLP